VARVRSPRDIVVKLHDAIVKAVTTPAVREKLVGVGADPLTMTVDEFVRFLRADIEKWDKVVKAAGVKIER
jgi:tripartite-type tricarboxylate transporter receptor subunit TctC